MATNQQDTSGNQQGVSVSMETQRANGNKSIVRFKVTSVLIPVFFFAGLVPYSTLLPEYLIHRLAKDAGENITLPQSGPCQDNGSDVSSNERQKEASTLVVNYSYAQNGPALLVCLLLGGFTDILGRRPFVIMGTLSGFLRMLLTAILIKFDLPLWVLYIAHAVDGIAGSWYTIFLGIYSGVADVMPQKAARVFWIAVVGTSIGLDSSLFLIVTGYVVDSVGFFWASMLGAISSGVSVLLALFVLPETYSPDKEAKFNIRDNLVRIGGFFFFGGTVRKRLGFSLCIFAFFFLVINMTVPATQDALYQEKEPFCWKALTIGLYGAERMGGQLILATIALKLLSQRVAVEWIAAIGLLFQVMSFCLEAFVVNTWQFFLVPVIGFLGTSAVPILRGVLSSLVSEADQGAIFSSVAFIEVGCQLFGNTVTLHVYTATINILPGAVYLVMAGFALVGHIFIVTYQCIREDEDTAGSYETLVEENHNIQGDDSTPKVDPLNGVADLKRVGSN